MADHCTAWPDRAFGLDWSHCCAAHDLAYETGAPRIAADLDLAACVSAATGWHWMAGLMFVGVLFFGWAFKARSSGNDGNN